MIRLNGAFDSPNNNYCEPPDDGDTKIVTNVIVVAETPNISRLNTKCNKRPANVWYTVTIYTRIRV